MQLIDPLARLLPVVLAMLLVPVGIKLSLIDILQGQVPALARPPASGLSLIHILNKAFLIILIIVCLFMQLEKNSNNAQLK